MKRVPLLLVVLAGLLAPARASAQSLDGAMQRISAAWHRGDAAAITALAARGGISLDVAGVSVGPLNARQASAVLRRVFDDRESVSTSTSRIRTVGGEPARAFGELNWTTRVRGTTIPERATFYFAFVREGDGWRITEIRLMR